jgi:hypothetical protein
VPWRKRRPFIIIASDIFSGAYAVSSFCIDPLTGSRAFIGRVKPACHHFSFVMAGNSDVKCEAFHTVSARAQRPLRLDCSVIGQQHLLCYIAYNRNKTVSKLLFAGTVRGCQNIMGFSGRSRSGKKGLPLKWNRSPETEVKKKQHFMNSHFLQALGSCVEPKVRVRVPPSVLDRLALSLRTVRPSICGSILVYLQFGKK